jgi:hypothetical protein
LLPKWRAAQFDDRKTLIGIICVLKAGIPRKDLPRHLD